MLQIIIFSYNRALQLDTLLNSLFSKWKSPSIAVNVLYNYSGKEFGNAYGILHEKFKNNHVRLILEEKISDHVKLQNLLVLENIVRLKRNKRLRQPQTNFRSLLIRLLEESSCQDVMFITDDSMFINDVSVSEEDLTWINSDPQNRQISLRLGNDIKLKPKNIVVENGGGIWNMYDNENDWGYLFSVDAHIYNKNFILSLFKKYLFINPNSLEAYINASVIRSKFLGNARCYKKTTLQTFPINIVQDEIKNGHQNVSVSELNDFYLKGYQMEYVYDSDIIGPKQTVRKLKFVDKEGNLFYKDINI